MVFEQLRLFFKKYQQFFSSEEIENTFASDNFGLALVWLNDIALLRGLEVYIFIDSYDDISKYVLHST